MSDAKHTAGPWYYGRYVEAQGREHYFVALNPDGNGFRVQGCEYMSMSGICKEEDARLIAAAPELLDALKYMIGDLDSLSIAACEMATAAIAKATGEPS